MLVLPTLIFCMDLENQAIPLSDPEGTTSIVPIRCNNESRFSA